MDFSWSNTQEALRERVAAAARSRLGADLLERDRQGRFDREGWHHCAELGLQGLPVPGRYGGGDQDPSTIAYALQGLGYGCVDNGLAFAIGAHLWGTVLPLSTFGTEEQKAHWLPGLASGSTIGALAVSEREAGSDAFHPRTTAERRGDGYVLNGHKVFVTNGPIADVLLVLATLDPGGDSRNLSVFLVERGMPGLTFGPPVDKMGMRTAAMGEVILDDCAVPARNRLGAEGTGVAVVSHAMLWERGLILAPAVGAMQRQLEGCTAYARERKQFGQPIGSFQLVSSRLVDMRLRLEQARLMLYRMAWLLGRGEPAYDFAALVKLSISEAWVASCQDALQIYGGYGYLTETGVERELRDALAARIYSGTSEIQRRVVARWMGVA